MDLFAQTKINKIKNSQEQPKTSTLESDINPITKVETDSSVSKTRKKSRKKSSINKIDDNDVINHEKFNIYTFLISCKELNKLPIKPYKNIFDNNFNQNTKIFIENSIFNDFIYYKKIKSKNYIVLRTSDIELIYLIFYFKDFLIENNISGIINFETIIDFNDINNDKYLIIKNEEMFYEFINFKYLIENKRCFMCEFYKNNVCVISN